MAANDARRSLNALRVQELRSLCKECGIMGVGRKSDLIARLVSHKQQCQSAASAEQTSGLHSLHPGPPPGPGQQQPRQIASTRRARGRPPGRRNTNSRIASDIGAGDRAAGSPASRPIRCSQCNTVFDIQCLRYTGSADAFWCPPCCFRVMDPLNPTIEPNGILKVVLLTQTRIDFLLDLPELRQWRRNGFGIECRMVSADSNRVCQVWPYSMTFCANSHEIFAIRPPEDGHKRRDVPIHISAGLKHGTNTISVRVAGDAVRSPTFVLAIVLTRPRELSELCQQVTCSKEHDARQRIITLLTRQRQASGGDDEEIQCLSNDMLQLQCPITMARIGDPVRGERCQHFQCFSLEAYIISNQQIRAFNNRWVCPVCSLVLRPPDLVRDEYVTRVLRETAEDVEEVAMNLDGTWRVPPQLQVRVQADNSSPEAVDLDDVASPTAKRQRLAPEESAGSTPSVLAPEADQEADQDIVLLDDD